MRPFVLVHYLYLLVSKMNSFLFVSRRELYKTVIFWLTPIVMAIFMI